MPIAFRHPILTAALLAVGTLAASPALAQTSQPAKPNFIVILGEGHGWASTSVQMDDRVAASKSRTALTPQFEKLAADGLRFTNFYVPSPRCTPSRAALFTGINPAALRMTFVGEGKADDGLVTNGRLLPAESTTELPRDVTTIAELLKTEGYAIAHFGKWHVGRTDPSVHGFDESDGPTNNGGPDHVDNPHPKQLVGMTDRGIAFLQRQTAAAKPFYLQLSHYASRQGATASPEAIAVVKNRNPALTQRELGEAATTYDLDLALGRLLKALDDSGAAKNTYVIFTTDHGTPGKNSPLAGGKGTVSDGGLRVPFIIRGPGIKPNTFQYQRVSTLDLLPTLASLAKSRAPLPKAVEGADISPLIFNTGKFERTRTEFVIHFPHYDKDPAGPASAIIVGNDKLVHHYSDNTFSLYNLAKDPAEAHDLAREQPDKLKQLQAQLTAYLQSVNATFPQPNPKYDPAKPTTANSSRGRR